jgi:DNA-binding NarL/FixJ family response regulator
MIRILIADDHKQVRKALRGTLEEYEWQVCGEASDGQEAVSLALQLNPDVAILDLSMPAGRNRGDAANQEGSAGSRSADFHNVRR